MDKKFSKRDIITAVCGALVCVLTAVATDIYKGNDIISNAGFFIIMMLFGVAVFFLSFILTQKFGEYCKKKRVALGYLGKEVDLKLLRKDKGAMLAYKGIVKCLDVDLIRGAECFENALKLNLPDCNAKFCYDWLLHCYRSLNHKEKYEDTLKRTVQALPTDDHVLYTYGDYLAGNGDYEKALYYFEQALKYNPNNEDVYDSLGQIAMDRMEYEKAIDYFNKALKINENFVGEIYMKALCHAAMDDFDNAERFMTQAVSMNAEPYETYRKKLDIIKGIKDGELRKEQTVD